MTQSNDHEFYSLAPYTFRCHDKNMHGENKYSELDKIGQHDLFKILKDFLGFYADAPHIKNPQEKKVFSFSDLDVDDVNREISVWFNVGEYGTKNDIIKIDTGEIGYNKDVNDAEIVKFYMHFYIPKGVNEAMAFLLSYRGRGVKTLFYETFQNYFRGKTDRTLQMNIMTYDKAIDAWLDAITKEIRLTRFEGVPNIEDSIKKLGHNELEQDLVIKAKRNKSLSGRLKDYINKDSPQRLVVTELEGFCSQIKTVVELNGKQRTFNIGSDSGNSLYEIELDETVQFNDGIPNFDSLKSWVKKIINEYSELMYPKEILEIIKNEQKN